MLRTVAWMVSNMMSVHVSRSDQSKVTPNTMFLRVADPDEDEL